MASLAVQLERSEARFRDVIERNADAIVVVDHGGSIRFANPAAERLFGTSQDALLGATFGFPLVAGETTEVDLPRGGSPRVAEMRVVQSEWEGAPACIASLRDITRRKEAEHNERRLLQERAARSAAEEAARRLSFLADSSTTLSSSLDYGKTLAELARLCAAEIADWAVVYVVDETGHVGRLEVAHRDPAMRGRVRALRDQSIAPESGHPVHEVLRTGKPILVRRVAVGDLNSISEDARHRSLLAELGIASYMMVPLVARGRSLAAIALVSADPDRPFGDDDLTMAQDLALRAALAVDNARLYREARDASEAKTQLLAVISHDLRTPLSSIIGYSDLLALGIPEKLGDASLQQVDRIRTGAKHLLYLIEELLAFSRVDSGREALQVREITLSEITENVAHVMEPLARERGLDFTVELPGETVVLRTDAGKLRQVLVNLTGNAVKFTEQGEVRLEATPEDGHVVFHIRDTGVGIAADHIDQIFQPFWQVKDTKAAGDGTGLGLSVVRRLVGMMGGEVSVESAVGQGSTFRIRLPRYLMEGDS